MGITKRNENKSEFIEISVETKRERRKKSIQFCDYIKETQFSLALEWLKLKS